MSYVYKA